RRHILPIERETEGAALVHFTLYPNRAVIGLDNALHARQSHALAGHIASRCILSSSENEEDFADVLGVDADSGIANVELRLGFADCTTYVNLFDCAVAH